MSGTIGIFYPPICGYYPSVSIPYFYRFVKRYYEISGNGYGYNSMQGAEHLNKTTKTILKTRTNGRTDMENYCFIAASMEIRDQRFIHLKIKGKHQGRCKAI